MKISMWFLFHSFFLLPARCCNNIQAFFSKAEGKYLAKNVIKTVYTNSEFQCSALCARNDNCLSVNYKTSGKNRGLCELNSKSLWKNTVLDKPKFTNLEIIKRIPETIGCCSTSASCINGGHCREDGERYKCWCPAGYKGIRCEIKPKSCADYVKSSNRKPGYRVIYPKEKQSLKVFCHFGENSTMTLVLSLHRHISWKLRKYSLADNYPLNETCPNWTHYRLSLANMQALRDVSTHWAFTCTYDTRGYSTIDYVLSRINETDLTTYNDTMEPCRRYEYVNINNNICENCRLYTYQGNLVAHFQADTLTTTYCDGFSLSEGVLKCVDGTGASYFGSYICYPLKIFNCTIGSATTQLWFIR